MRSSEARRDDSGNLALRATGAALFAGALFASGCRRAEPAKPHAQSSAAPSASAAPSRRPVAEPLVAARAGATREPDARPPHPLNVLLITIDSLRADVPWQGYGRDIAPNLTRLAAESVVYTRAYAASSYTAKSLATVMSGRFASTLYRDYRFFARYAPANHFLAEMLNERGVTTLAWHGHMYFGRHSGLEQGFSVWRLVPGIRFDPETDNDVTSDKMTALGETILHDDVVPGRRFFAWAHYMDPHDQYLKHAEAPDFGRWARDRYDGEIWFADRYIGKLLDWAHGQPWWQDTAVIVTADHGEAFGEHGMYKHAFELWDVLVHVPLLVYAPGVTPRRIDERRSHIDLAPTLFELLGFEPKAPEFQGKSFVPELYGAKPDVREPILCELAEDSHNPPRRAILDGDYKLIDFGREHYELYDLSQDPGEKTELSARFPAVFLRMKRLLQDKFAALPSVAPYGGGKLREGGRANGPTGPTG